MKPRSALLIVLLAAALGVLAGAGGFLLYEHRQGAEGALFRPEFALPDLDNEIQNVRQWDGKVLVLNFWATWCPPCVREVPIFVDLQRQHGEAGLQVVGIAVDRPEDAQTFAAQAGINYPLLYGVQSALEIGQLYGNDAGVLPFTVVIDRQGIIRHVFQKEVTRPELEAAFLPLLNR